MTDAQVQLIVDALKLIADGLAGLCFCVLAGAVINGCLSGAG